MNHQEALKYLDSFANHEKDRSFSYPEAFSLDRMKRLAKQMGNPQNAYDCIIIAGSKGKGSIAAMLSSILRMEDLKVGLYTSPHLLDLTERIRVNGLALSDARFTEYMAMLEKFLDDYAWRKDPPTYFEILTAIAFHHFKELKVHVAVLEVGLGGLYDATNIAEAKAVGMAPVSLEHTDILGKTISKIAVQKAGVIKGREKVISAPQPREAEMVFSEAAIEREAELFTVGKEIRIFEREYTEDSQSFDLRTPFGNFYDLKIPLLGEHQLENAAVAVGLAKALEKKTRLSISETAIRQGLEAVVWPGRLEKLWNHPRVILDGAHNPDSMRRSVMALRRHFHFDKIVAVLAVSADKDIQGILAELAPETRILIATEAGISRSMPAAEIAETAENFTWEIETEKDAWCALEKAKSRAGEEDLIFVSGSLYLVAQIKKEISQKDLV